ncbi:MAG: sigma-54-dependent transcriptional regulator [Planctomycetota bacterium]|jgi:DNA-binding NtrC family response regulator
MIAERPTVLVVDDDRNTRETLKRGLVRAGYETFTAEDGAKAVPILQEVDVDLIITDYKMPDMDGMRLAATARVVRPAVAVIMISAFASVDTAVSAVKSGIFDVIEKPVKMRDVKKAAARALENRKLLIENRRLRADLTGKDDMDRIIGRAPAFREAMAMVEQVAPVKSTVLLTGESGTGKEILANAVHGLSPRAGGPLVKVHCAALAEGLLETELFGHEEGAYTGAVGARKGRFETADGGTILLDEIGEIPLATQVKLLRVLQEGEFERVGGSETIRVDTRVIAATNADLQRAVSEGTFREDLYYRLNVISIEVPPLRHRREDVPLLVQHFVEKYSRLTGKKIKGIAPTALDRLQARAWPGNVRELENVVERAVVLATGELISDADVYSESDDTPKAMIPFRVGQSLGDLEREAIQRTLKAVDGDKDAAAKILGIGVATLYRRLKEMEEAQAKLAPDPTADSQQPTDLES